MSIVAPQPSAAATSAPAPAIRVEDIGKRYLLEGAKRALLSARAREDQSFWALRGVSFAVQEGERVGIIGRNGAGKSTLLKILSRVVTPSEGRAEIRGRTASLLEVGTGFNPRLSGRENIYLNAALLGLQRKDVDARIDDIIAFAEIGRFIEEPVKSYSTGMRARLGFAVAAHIDPDVLMLDEVLSVGDAAFQAKCLQRVGEMMGANPTLLFVSHSFAAIRQFCDRCIWLERGEVTMDGPVESVVQAYTDQVMSLRPSVKWGEPSRGRAAATAKDPLPDYEPKARMLGARVVAADGLPTSHLAVDSEFDVEVEYEILEDDAYVLPTFRFYAEDGHLVFTAVFSAPGVENWRRPRGRYRSRAHVPAHLLNVGLHRVSIGLNTPHSGGLMRHHVEESALTFWIHEARLGELSARGPYTNVRGAVRPMFVWTHEMLDEPF